MALVVDDVRATPCCSYDGMEAWRLEMDTTTGSLPIIMFRSTGRALAVDERDVIFDLYLNEARTQRKFIAVYDMLAGLESFATHLAAMAKFCMDARPITEKSLLFTVVLLASPASRVVLNALLAIVPPSKPLYVVGSEEEAWKIVTEGGTSSQLWRPE